MDINKEENTSSGEIKDSEEYSSNGIKATEDLEEIVQNIDKGNKGMFIERLNDKVEVLVEQKTPTYND
jgi:hypothetical protein